VPPLQQVAPDCPPALCRVIHRLLRKSRAERYESAEKLLDALKRVEARLGVDQAAVTAAGPPPPDTTRRARPVGGASLPRVFPKWLWLALPAAAVLVLILILILSSSPKQSPSAVAPPSTRTPTTQHRPPGRPAAASERNASTLFNNARVCIDRGDFPKAQGYLERLRAQYGKTQFAITHEVEIAALQKQIDASVKPTPPKPEPPRPATEHPPAPPPQPPKPEPPKPEPTPEAAAEAREEAAAAQRDARDRAVAAYAAQSDKLWALLKERKYADAEKLLAGIVGGAFLPREHVAADREALELLKGFWVAVERALAAKKGDFIAFGGAGGKIAEVKDGQVTVRGARDAEFKLSIYKLGAKQALHYSGLKLKADPRSKLTVAVLFIADGTAPDEAAEALEKAGDAPSVAVYRERLEALQMGAAEAAAKRAWTRIQEAARSRLSPATAKRLAAALAALKKQHGGTKFYKGLAEQIATVTLRIEDSLGYTTWPFDAKEARRRQKATAEVLGVEVEEEIDLGNGVKITLVLIPAGEFMMGSPPTTSPEQLEKTFGKDSWTDYTREFPQHRVKISKPFWLGKTEVTQAQWEAVMGDNPSKFKPRPQNPVEMVSWNHCQGFLQKLSATFKRPFRLPTEAEWEYACRAGAPTEFYFADGQAALAQHAWFGGNSGGSTQPVGKTRPNPWGLHDMAGNVWEWCEDFFAPYDKAPQVDPKGPGGGGARVLRGGSLSDGPRTCRSAHRNMNPPTHRHYHNGCRVCVVARTLK